MDNVVTKPDTIINVNSTYMGNKCIGNIQHVDNSTTSFIVETNGSIVSWGSKHIDSTLTLEKLNDISLFMSEIV